MGMLFRALAIVLAVGFFYAFGAKAVFALLGGLVAFHVYYRVSRGHWLE